MSFTLTDKLFNLFGVNAKLKDSFKDVNGKGINERYQQSLSEDYDENVQGLVDNGIANLITYKTADIDFLKYLEAAVGTPIFLSSGLRRKLLKLNSVITLTKGTLISYKILFNLISVSGITITVADRISGFDSPLTFDDDKRRFDGRAICCAHYTITLTGVPAINSTLIDQIKTIIYYLQPVNGEIDAVTYNATPISLP